MRMSHEHRYMLAVVHQMIRSKMKTSFTLRGKENPLPIQGSTPDGGVGGVLAVIAGVKQHCRTEERANTKSPVKTRFSIRCEGILTRVLVEFDESCDDPYCKLQLITPSSEDVRNPVPMDVVSQLPEKIANLREGSSFGKALADLGIERYCANMRIETRRRSALAQETPDGALPVGRPVKGLVAYDHHLRTGYTLSLLVDHDQDPPAFRRASLSGPDG